MGDDTPRASEAAGDGEGRWLSTGEVAALLGASVSTVQRLADSGRLETRRRKSWSGMFRDRLGRELQGRREISERSALRVKALRESGSADALGA